MSSDDFEKRLGRRTFRPIPGNWRQEILSAANAVSQAAAEMPTANSRWRDFLWPCPQAWAGLAAVWVVILTLNFAMDDTEFKSAKTEPSSPSTAATLREQRLLYLELAGLEPKPVAGPPSSDTPKPTSERSREITFA